MKKQKNKRQQKNKSNGTYRPTMDHSPRNRQMGDTDP